MANRQVAPQRREEIIQATIRCIAREGYTRLTMKTLAEEAGVSQGILHYYFHDKAAILLAALEAVATELEQRLTQALQESNQNPAQCLQAVVRVCLETALERPEVWRVYIEFWGEMLHEAHLATRHAALYAKMRRQMATILTQGMRQGMFRRLEVMPAAMVIVGLIDGVALQLTFDPQVLPLSTAIQCCTQAVQSYLRP